MKLLAQDLRRDYWREFRKIAFGFTILSDVPTNVGFVFDSVGVVSSPQPASRSATVDASTSEPARWNFGIVVSP